MFIISKEPLDKVVATVKNVSEIKDAEGEQIVIKEEETKVEEKPIRQAAVMHRQGIMPNRHRLRHHQSR